MGTRGVYLKATTWTRIMNIISLNRVGCLSKKSTISMLQKNINSNLNELHGQNNICVRGEAVEGDSINTWLAGRSTHA